MRHAAVVKANEKLLVFFSRVGVSLLKAADASSGVRYAGCLGPAGRVCSTDSTDYFGYGTDGWQGFV